MISLLTPHHIRNRLYGLFFKPEMCTIWVNPDINKTWKAYFSSLPRLWSIGDPLLFALQPFEKTGFIVGGEKPLTLSAYRAMWKRIKKTVDLHGATPHILRHSYLTFAVGSTTDYKTVQGISGHADLFTLVNRYAHPQEDKVNQLSAEITRILTQNVEKC